MSSDQLFFVYYALDNCERSDDAYHARAFDIRFELPPEDRVNFPLLKMDAFQARLRLPWTESNGHRVQVLSGRLIHAPHFALTQDRALNILCYDCNISGI
ncbi:hypothetical protein MTO96_001969 [Rhipicephalus appendiculatus]